MRHSAALIFLLVACSSSEATERLRALERTSPANIAAIEGVQTLVHTHTLAVQSLVHDSKLVRDDFAETARLYREVMQLARQDRERQRVVRETFEQAAERWHVAQQLIIAAASVDGSNLKSSSTRELGASCYGGMSTETYRHLLESAGVSLVGMQIDHIVPSALGGADHPLNYEILPSSLNESLGASFGPDKCALAGAAACTRAVAISVACGSYRGSVPSL